MDTESYRLIRKVWQHTGVTGTVWMPSIANIGKDNERFRENAPLDPSKVKGDLELNPDLDWYWTPGVSTGDRRKAKQYPAQRAIWADCDDNFNEELLLSLRPSYLWETSPGHMQAIWLMKEPVAASEYHRDGLMGMLTQALGADKSGVDISQLLRVPGTNHHKGKPFKGRILAQTGAVYTRSQMLSRVARGLGFSPALASELGATDPYGDRSKLLWKFSRRAAELGLEQNLTFKLIKATDWNKWREDPDKLKEDIARAYDQQPPEPKDPEQKQAQEQVAAVLEDEQPIEAWSMATVGQFGPVLRQPLKWVLPGIIPESGCGLIVAAPKVGKTRIAIEIALGLATARRALGIPTAKPQAVGFFSLEDGEYLFAERLASGMRGERAEFHWDGHITRHGKELTWHPPQSMPLLTMFSQIDLTDAGDQERLYETILKFDLKLVIIDTLSMAIGKANVSDQKDMYGVLKPLKDIAKATGCAVMFIHHTRKRVFEKGESIQESILGATALHGWSDFIMNVVPPEEDSDLLRMGVQTKRGSDVHYIDQRLKIIKRPEVED